MNKKQNNSKSNWKIESVGIDIVPEYDRRGKAFDLFWIWCAANIGILGVVYGGIIVSFKLSFTQSILAILCGISSFCLVGYISLAGKKGRTSTLTLSRVIFGIRGNFGPTLIAWINLMGWQVVNVIMGVLTISALINTIGISDNKILKIVSFIVFAGFTILVSMIGQKCVLLMQKWVIKIFGTLTLIVVVYIVCTSNWIAIISMGSGSWIKDFLPAVSIIAAGTGIGWGIGAADYSRYQSDSSRNSSIFFSVLLGAAIPLFLLIFAGVMLSARVPNLASSANPIILICNALPKYLAIPYLLSALVSIVAIAVLSLYSASLNLLGLGIKVKQIYAVFIDAIVILIISIYIFFTSASFMDAFVSFLIICGVFLSSWNAIFVADYFFIRKYKGYDFDALFGKKNRIVKIPQSICWIFGAISGLILTKTGFFSGPLAIGIFANSSLGLFVAFGVSFLLYSLLLAFISD